MVVCPGGDANLMWLRESHQSVRRPRILNQPLWLTLQEGQRWRTIFANTCAHLDRVIVKKVRRVAQNEKRHVVKTYPLFCFAVTIDTTSMKNMLNFGKSKRFEKLYECVFQYTYIRLCVCSFYVIFFQFDSKLIYLTFDWKGILINCKSGKCEWWFILFTHKKCFVSITYSNKITGLPIFLINILFVVAIIFCSTGRVFKVLQGPDSDLQNW